MDKRWIGILIILIAGLSCMYFIVTNSNSVGTAITVVNDVTIPAPDGFKIDDDNSFNKRLTNTQTNETIFIKCVEKDKNGTKEFTKILNSFQNNKDVTVKNESNATFEIIEFEDLNTGKNTTFVYFEKLNHSFILKMENFKENQRRDGCLNFMYNNMVHDYKQNK